MVLANAVLDPPELDSVFDAIPVSKLDMLREPGGRLRTGGGRRSVRSTGANGANGADRATGATTNMKSKLLSHIPRVSRIVKQVRGPEYPIEGKQRKGLTESSVFLA